MNASIEELSRVLKEKELILATAESCTGGMISAAITDLAGSSSVFDRGFVTYSNQSKQDLLNVSTNILNHYGAVSSQCADAMVVGALNNAQADIAVSVTGIAGPSGDSEDKPLGLVFIAVGIKGREPNVTECHFTGDRAQIRALARDKAIALLIEAALAI